jgi:hypothetical protein
MRLGEAERGDKEHKWAKEQEAAAMRVIYGWVFWFLIFACSGGLTVIYIISCLTEGELIPLY